MKAKSVLPTTYLLIFLGLMIVLHLLVPAREIIKNSWKLLGLLPLAVGVTANMMADAELHRAQTTVKPFLESNALVVNGVYRYSRNPMYLGFVLILFGVAFLLGSISPFFVLPVFVVLIERLFIEAEEQMLEVKFGQLWLDYKRRVRRWI